MKRKLQAVPTNGNIEQLAAEAKAKRESQCGEEVNKVLEKHNCKFLVAVKVGETAVPLDQILAFPSVIITASK